MKISKLANNLFHMKISDLPAFIQRYVKVKNQNLREMLAEFLGTFLLVVFGCGSVAQFVLDKNDKSLSNGFLSVNLSFGFGATVACCVIGKISGN